LADALHCWRRTLRDVDTGTVRRVMSVRPGNVFQQDALYQTQRDLYGMGVFRYANVLLPATTWGEKSGSVTNSERRISRQRPFLPAPGSARADWRIICDVARRMGFAGFDYADVAEMNCGCGWPGRGSGSSGAQAPDDQCD